MAITQHKMKKFKNISIYPYLKVLDIQQYKEIVLQELRKLAEGSETFSPSTNQLYHELGHQVRSRYIIKYKKTNGIMGKTQQLYSEYLDWFLDPNKKNDPRSLNAREEWQKLLHKHQEGPTINVDDHVWPITVLTGIGRFLYNIILRDIKIDVNVQRGNSKPHWLPAFYSVYRVSGHKSVEEIKPHPVLSRLYRQAVLDDLVFNVSELPMLTPPVPWTSPTSGGNLLVKTEFIRLPSSASLQLERLKTASPEQLYPSYDSLNQLASVPWKVNQPVLDVVIHVFNTGGDVKLDIPQPPTVCPLPQPITTDMTKLERFEAYRQRMLLRRRKAEMYSLWCDALYRLSLAQHFRDRIFWLPHNMDFRGRVYPCPPHLNHLGADMARSLLCFARGEPLGPNGLNWLKIHLVNLLGTKKRESIQGRLDYANEVMPDIIDSADDPLNGRKWWCESEEPWQTLACCKEIVAAMRHPAGSEKYVCHFPVHQDGSCNGLQHYAALGRDEAGGFSVNLLPAEVPQDVYNCVANIVERERAKDAESGNNIAKVLEGFVRRKVIKQTVMTTVYGVTRYGARLQIVKQLKDIDEFPKEHVWTASSYLVGKTFESIREMFTSTREIQDWFTECAKLIAQVCGQNVEYITPLGLPVVQPYSRSLKKIEIYTKTGKVQENFSLDKFERPNVMKQKNAFPPNFVHSLDSTHMMLTSLHCEQEGITFVSVHDCYWTHPSTVAIMNKICREQFVSLHSEPILQDLSKYFIEKYRYNDCEASKDNQVIYKSKSKINTVLSDVPQRGDLQLEKVLDSVYFFS
uniref:DNA-directed RNA polymerase n=1 Tax=Clastoptera arizonana TaxID=38151 RepID=A0A1B6DWP1_9HEMI